jgi:hypothetical protein
MQSFEAGFAGLVELQIIGEQAPHRDGQAIDDGIFDTAEPSHEDRRPTSRQAIGQQEIDALAK